VHELAITESIVDAIVEKIGDGPVAAVRLEIGRLSGVVTEFSSLSPHRGRKRRSAAARGTS
jgi:Zn finger protein HypA/HybF involved in hydrogenase expression